MQAILVNTSTTNYKQLVEFCSQFKNQNINVYIYNDTFTYLKKCDLETSNIKFIHKPQVSNVEISLLKFALQNKDNTHFHLVNEYSFIFPDCILFEAFFKRTQQNFISTESPQWSITRVCAEYVVKNYTEGKNIIDILMLYPAEDIIYDNLRFYKERLSVIQLRHYIADKILSKLIIHNIDCNSIGYEQILKQLKYIYLAVKNERKHE